MKIKEVLKIGNEILIKNGVEDSFLKSKILLSHILNVSKEYLIIHDEEEILNEPKELYLNGIRKNFKWRTDSIHN